MDNTPDDNNPVVIAYRMTRVEKAVNDGFDKTAMQIRQITEGFVAKALYEEHRREAEKEHTRLQKQIDAVNKNITWIVRLVISALVTAAIAALIAL